MSLGSATLASVLVRFVLGSATLMAATACLTPPSLRQTTPPTAKPGSDAKQAPSRAFSHTSRELLAPLTLGWNLGNSLDAPESETAWGNPDPTPDRSIASAHYYDPYLFTLQGKTNTWGRSADDVAPPKP